ncbi:DUF5133 domain-containing protein [Streptomyces sp. NPDC047000]|uniref:DUF5133 domain-containing protein n=1 Tax=Streptomyces sp. NPDC047000 TaxID=3155474 RepID=UPI0033CC26EE
MLMPLPATLRRLVQDYETALAEETLVPDMVPSPRLRDLAYTLCVTTGTRQIAEALEIAHSCLASAAAGPARTVTLPHGQGPAPAGPHLSRTAPAG